MRWVKVVRDWWSPNAKAATSAAESQIDEELMFHLRSSIDD